MNKADQTPAGEFLLFEADDGCTRFERLKNLPMAGSGAPVRFDELLIAHRLTDAQNARKSELTQAPGDTQ
jgi:hypothetical protein